MWTIGSLQSFLLGLGTCIPSFIPSQNWAFLTSLNPNFNFKLGPNQSLITPLFTQAYFRPCGWCFRNYCGLETKWHLAHGEWHGMHRLQLLRNLENGWGAVQWLDVVCHRGQRSRELVQDILLLRYWGQQWHQVCSDDLQWPGVPELYSGEYQWMVCHLNLLHWVLLLIQVGECASQVTIQFLACEDRTNWINCQLWLVWLVLRFMCQQLLD